MRKLKIAWLHSHFQLWMGGTKFIYEVTTRIRKTADVEIYVESADPSIAARFADAGVPVTELTGRSSSSMLYWLLFPFYLWRDLRALRRLVGDHDVVVANVFPTNWLASRLKKPFVFFCFDPFLFFYDDQMIRGLPLARRIPTRLLGMSYRWLDKAGTDSADAILTLNNTTAGWIRKIYGRESMITFAGVDTVLFHKRPGLPPEDPWAGRRFIIHSTDYSPVKGTASVIEAFAKVRETIPDVSLVVTHTREDRPGRDRLLEQAARLGVSRFVEFLGFVDVGRLAELYSAAAVLVAPQRGMSLPVQEAMASETPVVRNASNTDEVVDGESGFLVDTDDTDAFADAIKNILNDAARADRMGKAGRATILNTFSWEKVCDKVLEAVAAAAQRSAR